MISDMISNKDNLSQSFSDSIKGEVVNIVGEISEVGIDSIMEDDIIKSIPFVSTVVSVYKIGSTIRERHHLKKLAIFIDEINKNINNDNRETYMKRFEENKKIREQELEYITIILDRYTNVEKSKWLANLYLAYLRQQLSWREFMQYSEIINTLLPGDEIFLKNNNVPKDIPYRYYDIYVERFCTMGLLEKEYIQEPVPNISGKPIPVQVFHKIKNSELGVKLFRIIFK